MRVVSLVPSWTETLLECGVNVVGRTRFCIHPQNNLPIVGGTKNLDLAKLAEINPDLLLLDREENLPEMAAHPNAHVTHVQSIRDLPRELEELSRKLENQKLLQLAREWREELAAPKPQQEIPGILEWIKKPAHAPQKTLYLIWKNPWMAAAPQTFIGSIFEHLAQPLSPQEKKYPEIDFANYDPETTLLLFSSEPYPFARHRQSLPKNFPSAIIDGEAYSWFGLRSLRFLQSLNP